jgi:hypothetical protein
MPGLGQGFRILSSELSANMYTVNYNPHESINLNG